MKKNEKSLGRHTIASILLAFAMVLAIILLSGRENYARQIVQIQEYISVLSERTADHVSDVFSNKNSAISLAAFLYGQLDHSISARTPSIESDYLSVLESDANFDIMRYVDINGMSYTSDGQSQDVSDREYYKLGIKGESGYTVVMESRFNNEKLIGFYSPVKCDGEITGVLIGFLRESAVSAILSTELYGYPAFTMLIGPDGDSLGQYHAQGLDYMADLDSVIDRINVSDKDELLKATADRRSVDFKFNGNVGMSVGMIQPINGSDWSLM